MAINSGAVRTLGAVMRRERRPIAERALAWVEQAEPKDTAPPRSNGRGGLLDFFSFHISSTATVFAVEFFGDLEVYLC